MLVALLLVQALAASAPLAAPAAPTQGQTADRARLAQCAAAVDKDADAGYETARQWIAEAHVREAYVCSALADIGRKKPDLAARQFESLSVDAPNDADRADMLSRAGNAWLLARDAARAKSAFDHAVQVSTTDPDLFIDRARASALGRQWRQAEEDLSAALDLRPKDPLALRLRAEARLRQSAFELAEKDAAEAAGLEPRNVETLLTLGRAREARRLGHAPD
jgi:tetratricopeptide (TPR) repeat protein